VKQSSEATPHHYPNKFGREIDGPGIFIEKSQRLIQEELSHLVLNHLNTQQHLDNTILDANGSCCA